MLTQADFAARRHAFLAKLPKNSLAIIAAAPEKVRNNDVHYPYRQDSDFYYLTGIAESETIAVFSPGHEQGDYLLFNRVVDPEKTIWEGALIGQADAVSVYQADAAYPIEEFEAQLPTLMADHKAIYYPLLQHSMLEECVEEAKMVLEYEERSGLDTPHQFIAIESILHEMRVIKNDAEIQIMRKSAEITVAAHLAAMKACKPGAFEYTLDAELQYTFAKKAAKSSAYPNIVASGKNACILHYIENQKQLDKNDLILIDAGSEYQYYAADVTRTFPASGKFSEAQKRVYDIVLDVQHTVIDLIKPGVAFNVLQKTCIEKLTTGLITLGILTGSVEDNIEKEAYKSFYMHGVSHWLGMDVHDAGSYKVDGEWRLLEPGMVLTVEPGLYIKESSDVDKKWWDIGIRIEDDVLVTEKGADVLTNALPKTTEAIEKLMAAA